MSLPHREAAIQMLTAYQDRLDAAHGKAGYDALFDGAPAEIGLHEIDLDKHVTRVNPAELALLGYRREEVVGHPAWRFTVLQETSQRAAEKKLAGGGLVPFVRTFKRADGAALTMALVERYRRDAAGTIVGIRTALTPIEAESGPPRMRGTAPGFVLSFPAVSLLACAGLLASAPSAAAAARPVAQAPAQPPAQPAGVRWREALQQPGDWYGSPEARRIASQVLRFQHASGGWGKNIDLARPYGEAEIRELLGELSGDRGSTIDNGATWTELRFLARVFAATGDGELAPAFARGLDYLLDAQYANGGWPQFHPAAIGYRTHITYNDGAMVGVLELLRDVAAGRLPAGLVDATRRARAEAAVARGIRCILKTQVLVEGRLTVWCAQHDEHTLAPAAARTFELVSLSGGESVGILRFLMSEPRPSAEIVRAVVAGVAWFRQMRIDGLRVESVAAPGLPGGRDRVVRSDPAAPPLWARFYEIPSGRPLFVGRDGVARASLAEIEHERRVGYAWYVDWPRLLIEQEFPAWAAVHAPEAAPAPVKPGGE